MLSECAKCERFAYLWHKYFSPTQNHPGRWGGHGPFRHEYSFINTESPQAWRVPPGPLKPPEDSQDAVPPVTDACARRNSVCDRAGAGHRGRCRGGGGRLRVQGGGRGGEGRLREHQNPTQSNFPLKPPTTRGWRSDYRSLWITLLFICRSGRCCSARRAATASGQDATSGFDT